MVIELFCQSLWIAIYSFLFQITPRNAVRIPRNLLRCPCRYHAAAGCAATGNLIWATMGTMLFPLYKKYNTVINVVMALLLVWCAWKIIFL